MVGVLLLLREAPVPENSDACDRSDARPPAETCTLGVPRETVCERSDLVGAWTRPDGR